MKFSGGTLLALLFIALAGGIYYYEYFAKGGPHAPLKETPPPAAETAAAPAAPLYPVPAEEGDEQVEGKIPALPKTNKKALPAEKKGPVSLEDALAALFGAKQATLFDLDGLVGHFVVAVENEPGPQIPPQFLPMKPAEGSLEVRSDNGETTLDPRNYQRYRPYVQLLDLVSAKKLVDFYVRYYPLFQKAYRENGSQGYFNDKVVAAVENLLAAPDVKEPVKLVQPNVFYHFADPQLESLSAGQKIMVRMGPENAAHVKAKLNELHQLLTHLGAKAAS